MYLNRLFVFQYSYNSDQSIHDVFASIRMYWYVIVSIERGLICIRIAYVCIESVFLKTPFVLVCTGSVFDLQIRMYC